MSGSCPVLGFVVETRVRADAAAQVGALAGELVRLLESNGLLADRPSDRTYIVSREGAQATDADRQLVLQWADRWRGVADIAVSDLIDLSQA